MEYRRVSLIDLHLYNIFTYTYQISFKWENMDGRMDTETGYIRSTPRRSRPKNAIVDSLPQCYRIDGY